MRATDGVLSSVNTTICGRTYPGEKLVCFALFSKYRNVNKTRQLIPGKGSAILRVMEQGTLTEGEVSVHLTSLFKIPCFVKRKNIFSV